MARADSTAENIAPQGLTANNLEAFWMPFTANRQFKKAPRLLVARRGHALLDATTGARCSTAPRACGACNAGHGRDADRRGDRSAQVGELDYAPTFQMGHPNGVRAGRAARRACCRTTSTTSSSPTPARSRSTPR